MTSRRLGGPIHVAGVWLAMWVPYVALVQTTSPLLSLRAAALLASAAITSAALLSVPVVFFVDRLAWPRPFRLRFLAAHAVGAMVFAAAWIVLAELLAAVIVGHGTGGFRVPRFVLGAWLYTAVAGVAYAIRATDAVALATERATRAEALVAEARLAALRGQLNPHFLLNALHTVVQLIPQQPKLAASAAIRLGELLRRAIDEERDLVRLADEWGFTSGYLELEQLRFGDRLRIDVAIDDDALEALIPSFTLQTLAENAVRHGAEPKVAPTRIAIRVAAHAQALCIDVRDDGQGARPPDVVERGTGLRRLRARLDAHYGGAAACVWDTAPGAGFRVTVTIPWAEREPAWA